MMVLYILFLCLNPDKTIKSNDKKKEEGGGSYMIPGPIPEPL